MGLKEDLGKVEEQETPGWFQLIGTEGQPKPLPVGGKVPECGCDGWSRGLEMGQGDTQK